jgi:hypothetical protein
MERPTSELHDHASRIALQLPTSSSQLFPAGQLETANGLHLPPRLIVQQPVGHDPIAEYLGYEKHHTDHMPMELKRQLDCPVR